MPQTSPTLNRVTGGLLVIVTATVLLREWHLLGGPGWELAAVVVLLVAILTPQLRRGRQAFVLAAAAITLALSFTDPDWLQVALRGALQAGFIAAFFSALATLRSAAERAPSIRASGTFLSQQPPGRRYLALTLGGEGFALLLNYGAIALLGSLATAAAHEEPDLEIRNHRTRRMMLAIQRGFVASLPWSPMSFAVAISTVLIPGTSYGTVLLPALGTSLLLTVIGWSLDTLFKPRLSHPPAPRKAPEGSWALMLPLLILLAILGVSVLALEMLTGLRVVALVLFVVPAIALIWTWMQTRSGAGIVRRAGEFALGELPAYRGEIALLMMAGYIGTVGAPLLVPMVQGSGLHPEVLPAPLVLAGLVWLIPLMGQFGMNPILAVTLIAPLIPSAEVLGVTPVAVVTAITAGWALGGISSPFTATTLLVGSFGNVSASHVGLRWNGPYMLVALVVLPLWVLAYAYLIG